MFRKAKELTPREESLLEMEEAKKELDYAKMMFDFAEQDYFEVANASLTAAEERYKAASTRMSKIFNGAEGKLPHRDTLREHTAAI